LNLDQFINLERVGNTIYLGFNDGIERVVFPKLVDIDGALVVEANPRIKELLLPNLVKIGRYLHIHDNAALEKIEMPKLQSVAGELSIVDNPKLVHVKVGAPATAESIEVMGNGAKTFAGLNVK
jgi:hypothetical protein